MYINVKVKISMAHVSNLQLQILYMHLVHFYCGELLNSHQLSSENNEAITAAATQALNGRTFIVQVEYVSKQ